MIVSDIAGTTRDAIDTEVVHNGKEYVFIDTAGLRRKNKIKEELERYSIIRTVTHDLSISLPVEAIVGIARTGKASCQATFFSNKSQILSVSASVIAAMALEASIVEPPPIPRMDVT